MIDETLNPNFYKVLVIKYPEGSRLGGRVTERLKLESAYLRGLRRPGLEGRGVLFMQRGEGQHIV